MTELEDIIIKQDSEIKRLQAQVENCHAAIESLKAALVLMHINELSRDGKAFHDYTPDAEIQLAREMPEIFGDAK